MVLPSVAYADYRDYGGKLSEAAFDASLRAALAAVRDVIGFNVPECPEQEAAYRNAVCAAVEVDQAYGASGGIGEGMASMSIGPFSASGNDSCVSAYDLDMARSSGSSLARSWWAAPPPSPSSSARRRAGPVPRGDATMVEVAERGHADWSMVAIANGSPDSVAACLLDVPVLPAYASETLDALERRRPAEIVWVGGLGAIGYDRRTAICKAAGLL